MDAISEMAEDTIAEQNTGVREKQITGVQENMIERNTGEGPATERNIEIEQDYKMQNK